MTTRCEGGHEFRFYGTGMNNPDDHEVDMGVCPKCCGRGCENNVDEQQLLIDCAQLIDSVKMEWEPAGSWSEWDQKVRDCITRRLRWITTMPEKAYDEIQF